MRANTMIRRAVLPALVAAVMPMGLSAQTVAFTSSSSLRPEATTRAEELHARAMAEAEGIQVLSMARLRRLADLHVRAAELYAAGDQRGITCLQHAANLLHRHDPGRAARLREMGADRALALGDVGAAAHGYIDAGVLIQRGVEAGVLEGEEWISQAQGLAARATLLASSPLLAEADRVAILRRIQ